MKAKTVHRLALTFVLACGAGFTTIGVAEGIGGYQLAMGKSDNAANAVASLGFALCEASLMPAIGFGFWADAKKKSEDEQKHISPSPPNVRVL
jgi:hypothetical protein